jgi:hypothetical protein
MFAEIFLAILVAAIAIWEIFSRWRRYRGLRLHGILVQARVTDIKQEMSMEPVAGFISTRGMIGPLQKIKYENFLYAQWQDPTTQQEYLFRTKIPAFYQYHVGEPIMVKVNAKDPSEYRIQFAGEKRSARKSLPHSLE